MRPAGDPSLDRLARGLFWALLALFTLLVFELGARATSLDMVALRPLLLYQMADLAVHEPRPDPELLYGLKPGARAVFADRDGAPGRVVTVNSLGFRDRPRAAAKPAGVTRVVCLGFSHMYGARVSDDETLPRYLEETLNRGFQGRFEVWNAGVSAYQLPQELAAARQVLARYGPDLLLLATDNQDRRAFLFGQPFQDYFRKDPRLYRENLAFIPWSDRVWGWRLFLASALYRTGVIAGNALAPRAGPRRPHDEDQAELADFLASCRGRTKAALLSFGSRPGPARDQAATPSISLYGSPFLPSEVEPEYYMVHPPAPVYKLQAQVVARELARDFPGLLRPKVPGRSLVERPRWSGREPFPCGEIPRVTEELLSAGQAGRAAALLKRLTEKTPRRDCAELRMGQATWLDLARAAARSGDARRALDLVRASAQEGRSQDSGALLSLAADMKRLGQPDAARAALDLAAGLRLDSQQERRAADLYLELGAPKPGLALLQKRGPQDAASLLQWAASAERSGRQDAAREALAAAQALDLDAAQLRFAAELSGKLGEPRAARELLRRLLARPSRDLPLADIKDAGLLLDMADEAVSAKDPALALRCARQARGLELTPEQLGRTAVVYQGLQEFGRALEVLDALAARQPAQARWRSDRGVLKILMGRPEEAAQDLRRAVDLDPRFLPAVLSLGALYASSGRRQEALRLYEKALAQPATARDSADARRLRQELARLRRGG